MKRMWMLAPVLLAGCTAAAGNWTKPGADEAAAAAAYADCRGMAAAAIAPERGINQDIYATRGADWQRSQVGRAQAQTMRENTRDRGAAIVAACMRSKGFVGVP